MAVTDPALFNAILKKVLPPSQEGPCCRSNDLTRFLRKNFSYESFRLLEVLFTIGPNGLPLPEGIDMPSSRGLGIESGEEGSKCLNCAGVNFPLF